MQTGANVHDGVREAYLRHFWSSAKFATTPGPLSALARCDCASVLHTLYSSVLNLSQSTMQAGRSLSTLVLALFCYCYHQALAGGEVVRWGERTCTYT